eukprot:g12694.t1
MEPAFSKSGDVLLYDKFSKYFFPTPDRGQVVVLTKPDSPGVRVCKRVVGIGGDFVRCEVPVDELGGCSTVVQLSDGREVQGDNKPLSLDSRHYGAVPIGLIEGRVRFRLWPLSFSRSPVKLLPEKSVKCELCDQITCFKHRFEDDHPCFEFFGELESRFGQRKSAQKISKEQWELVLRVVSNVIKKQDNKYRFLKRANETVKAQVFSSIPLMRIFAVLGFEADVAGLTLPTARIPRVARVWQQNKNKLTEILKERLKRDYEDFRAKYPKLPDEYLLEVWRHKTDADKFRSPVKKEAAVRGTTRTEGAGDEKTVTPEEPRRPDYMAAAAGTRKNVAAKYSPDDEHFTKELSLRPPAAEPAKGSPTDSQLYDNASWEEDDSHTRTLERRAREQDPLSGGMNTCLGPGELQEKLNATAKKEDEDFSSRMEVEQDERPLGGGLFLYSNVDEDNAVSRNTMLNKSGPGKRVSNENVPGEAAGSLALPSDCPGEKERRKKRERQAAEWNAQRVKQKESGLAEVFHVAELGRATGASVDETAEEAAAESSSGPALAPKSTTTQEHDDPFEGRHLLRNDEESDAAERKRLALLAAHYNKKQMLDKQLALLEEKEGPRAEVAVDGKDEPPRKNVIPTGRQLQRTLPGGSKMEMPPHPAAGIPDEQLGLGMQFPSEKSAIDRIRQKDLEREVAAANARNAETLSRSPLKDKAFKNESTTSHFNSSSAGTAAGAGSILDQFSAAPAKRQPREQGILGMKVRPPIATVAPLREAFREERAEAQEQLEQQQFLQNKEAEMRVRKREQEILAAEYNRQMAQQKEDQAAQEGMLGQTLLTGEELFRPRQELQRTAAGGPADAGDVGAAGSSSSVAVETRSEIAAAKKHAAEVAAAAYNKLIIEQKHLAIQNRLLDEEIAERSGSLNKDMTGTSYGYDEETRKKRIEEEEEKAVAAARKEAEMLRREQQAPKRAYLEGERDAEVDVTYLDAQKKRMAELDDLYDRAKAKG